MRDTSSPTRCNALVYLIRLDGIGHDANTTRAIFFFLFTFLFSSGFKFYEHRTSESFATCSVQKRRNLNRLNRFYSKFYFSRTFNERRESPKLLHRKSISWDRANWFDPVARTSPDRNVFPAPTIWILRWLVRFFCVETTDIYHRVK